MSYTIPVNVYNNQGVIYLQRGADPADGDIKMIPDLSTGEDFELQRMENGVWNDTGLVVGADTVKVARELGISAAGSHILTRDLSEAIKGLVPRILFTTLEGTGANFAQVPDLSGLIANVDIQPDQTSESTKTDHTYVWTGAGDEFTFQMHVEVGTVAASDDVTLTLYRGSDNTGAIFFTQNYPSSDFPIDTRVSKELGGMPETFEGQDIFIEYKSDVAFALKGDALGNMYVAHCYHDVIEENLMTLEAGLGQVLTDEAGMVLSDEAGDLIYE